MIDETSITRQLQRESTLEPPYCPTPKCPHHVPSGDNARFWRRHGMVKLQRFPYASQRFQCKTCNATFSASFFELYYRQKVWGHNTLIWEYFNLSASMRATARKIHHSERLVRTRLRNMSRWAELKHAQLTAKLKIEEPIVYDGLENFAYSQYDPNNINHAIGKNTLFIYDFNFCPLNRKGRMSPWQKRKKKQLENRHGTYPKNAIRTSTKRIFERLIQRTKGELTLHTDRHFQYARALKFDLPQAPVRHIKTSSKVCRNHHNPLFAVNNVDLQARHNLAAFKRETIAFNKHEIAMQDSFLLYATYRNYMRPMFWGTHRSDPDCAVTSPAMKVGLTKKIWSFDEFFSGRVLPSQVVLNEDAKARYERREIYSRRTIALAPAI